MPTSQCLEAGEVLSAGAWKGLTCGLGAAALPAAVVRSPLVATGNLDSASQYPCSSDIINLPSLSFSDPLLLCGH